MSTVPSPLHFSQDQLAELSTIKDSCIAKGDTVGAWQEFYSYLLATILQQSGLIFSSPDSYLHSEILIAQEKLPINQFQVAVWLLGALDVNRGLGSFSTMIREYNKRQGILRGYEISDVEMQRSSNKVGANMADQILGVNSGEETIQGLFSLPTVQQIGEYDLNGVRDVLFPGNRDEGSEFYLNQTWPGIIMLGIQGGQFTDRLLRPNNDEEGQVAVDTLQDFQNMVFAWESFRYSFNKAALKFFSPPNGVNTLAIAFGIFDVATLAEGFLNPYPKWWFKKMIATQDPTAAAALGKIADVGTLPIIDFLRGARQGSPVTRKTTEVSLMDDCLTLFSVIDKKNPTGVKASFMPTNAADIISLVKTDMSARAALMALSPIKLDISSDVIEKMKASPWFGNTPAGTRWVSDRADMLVAQFLDGYQTLAEYTDKTGDISAGAHSIFASFHVTFGADATSGTSGLDRLYGTDGADVLSGKGGADELYGGEGNDWLGYDSQGFGGESLDEIEGNGNVYAGGKGNDAIAGSKSKDTYFFSKEDGVDFIATNGGSDDLILDSLSIKEDTVSFVRDQSDLLVVIFSTSPNEIVDKVRIRNWFDPSTSSNQLGRVVLGEKIWTAAEITLNVLEQHGTAGADQMTGLVGYKNTFFAGAGDDVIVGGSGESRSDLGDTFEGGLGSDDITGTLSSDTYLYATGDGQDVIKENGGALDNLVLSNIDINNAVFYSLGNDLIASFGSSTDSITIKDWYLGDSHKIESWTFSNGATITGADVEQRAGKGVIGTTDSDFLNTDWLIAADEVFLGGAGDDYVYIDWGRRSTILFYKGDGSDTIDSSGVTTLLAGIGLGSDFSVQAMPEGVVVIKWSSGDQLLFNRIDGPWASGSFTLKLNDHSVYTATQIVDRIDNTPTEGADILHANSRFIDLQGAAGNDELWGSTQGQILNGGSGNDTLRGNGGADYYIGGAGDDFIIADISNSGSTFVFEQGSDHDMVNLFNVQEGKIDTLRIVKGEGIDTPLTVDDLIFSKINAGAGSFGYYDLCVSIVGRNDSITIKNFISPNGRASAIDRIVFDDGFQMSYDDIRIKIDADYDPTAIIGTDQGDYLPGNNLATKIYGKAGVDNIESSNIAELLDGGDDDDYIIAGTGDLVVGGLDSDTIVASGDSISIKVGLNSGSDNIYLNTVSHTTLVWEGISAQDITARIDGANLIVSAKGDNVTFQQYFNGRFSQSDRNIDSICFDEGSSLSNSSLLALSGYDPYSIRGTNSSDYLEGDGIATKLLGLGGDDTISGYSTQHELLFGGAGNDVLLGGDGDTLIGGAGDDIYDQYLGEQTSIWSVGDGSDTIYAGPEDLLKFDNLSGVSSISVSRYGNDLALAVNTGGGVTIKNYFTTAGGPKIELPNGKIWTSTQIASNFTPPIYGWSFPSGVANASNFVSIVSAQGREFERNNAYFSAYGWGFQNVWNKGLQYGTFTGLYVNGHPVRQYGEGFHGYDTNYSIDDYRYGVFAEVVYQFWDNGVGGYDFSIVSERAGSAGYIYNTRDINGDGVPDTWDSMSYSERINYSWMPTQYIVSPAVTSFNLLENTTLTGFSAVSNLSAVATELPKDSLHSVVSNALNDFSLSTSPAAQDTFNFTNDLVNLNLGQLLTSDISLYSGTLDSSLGVPDFLRSTGIVNPAQPFEFLSVNAKNYPFTPDYLHRTIT